jgi:prepilin-type processing-associated H-X9-DG protein
MKITKVEHRGRPRSGLTLLEVIVIIFVVLTVLSLILPAMQSACVSRRRMQCQENLRLLTLGTMNYASNHAGQLPDLRSGLPEPCNASIDPAVPSSISFHITLLPFLDNMGAIESITQQTNAADANAALLSVLGDKFSSFTCSDSPQQFRIPGANSYVANAGYGEFTAKQGKVTMGGLTGLHSVANWPNWDLAHAPDVDSAVAPTVSLLDKQIARATGVFWIPDADGWKPTLDDIVNGDGSGQTLMYTENLNASPLNLPTAPTPMDNGFVVGRQAISFVDVAPKYLGFTNVPQPFEFRMNINKGTLVGQSPIPSSKHGDGVNISYCDGHVWFLSSSIDASVYVRLMSPNGQRWGQTPVKESDF